jgi:hypothetical protein
LRLSFIVSSLAADPPRPPASSRTAPAVFDRNKVPEQFGELGDDVFSEFIFAA